MKEIQVCSGIHGTRQLAAAYAIVLLRRRGYIRPSKRIGNQRGAKPWTDGEHDDAIMMRRRGATDATIAQTLNRTIPAIQRAIGYGPKTRSGAAA